MTNRMGLLKYSWPQQLFVSSYFTYKRFIEDPFASLVRSHPELFRKGHILDVGANIGYTASVFSGALKAPYQVFAFEPEGHNMELLIRSITGYGQQARIVPVHAAVGDHDGVVDLWVNPGHHADHRIITTHFQDLSAASSATQQVPLVSLDSFCEREIPGEPVSFIKVDVQGFEEKVVIGMARTLQRNPDAIVALEYFPEGIAELGFNPGQLLSFFETRGYQMNLLDRHGIRRTSLEALAALKGPEGYVDLVFSKASLDQAASV